MSTAVKKPASSLMVILAFAIVYVVWGSTYFFIGKAVHEIPALIMGALRFLASGTIMLIWCLIRGEKLWDWQQFKAAAVTGLLLLLVGNGAVIWAEKTLPSSLVAVLISSAPLWFVLVDKPKWKENFTNRNTIMGLLIGFVGIILLFSEQVSKAIASPETAGIITGLIIVLVGCMSWAGGSIYSKYNSKGSATVNTMWQMLIAGFAFLPGSFINNEWSGFDWSTVSTGAWLSLAYLVIFGSIIAYSAYVWLLQVRSATQVSTYAYVNPVVAVLLGVFFAGEHMSWLQVTGLAIILGSVLLINLAKYRSAKNTDPQPSSPAIGNKVLLSSKEKATA